MPVKHPFLLYLRSRLNLWISAGAIVLILVSAALGSWALPGVAVVIGAYVVVTAGLFFSRKGAEEIVTESEEDRLKGIRQKIQHYAELRERISVLRIGDESMRKSLEYFLLVSGTYIDTCRELGLYSPRANKRIEDVLEVCQVFLGEKDEGATEKRYGLAASEDLAKESVEAVMAAASDIKQAITEDLEGLSGKDRLSIIEELEGKQ